MNPGAEQFRGAEPTRWFLCFHKTSAIRWMRWLSCGKYKHVSAFGCVNLKGQVIWVFYDAHFYRTSIVLAHDRDALPLMQHWAAEADLISIRPSPRARHFVRLGLFSCVPAIKHLIGLRSGALRPDTFWRDCLAQGGEIVENTGPPAISAAAA